MYINETHRVHGEKRGLIALERWLIRASFVNVCASSRRRRSLDLNRPCEHLQLLLHPNDHSFNSNFHLQSYQCFSCNHGMCHGKTTVKLVFMRNRCHTAATKLKSPCKLIIMNHGHRVALLKHPLQGKQRETHNLNLNNCDEAAIKYN